MTNKAEQIRKHISRRARRAWQHFWDHLIPHEGNKHHPHLLKHRVLLGYSMVLILLKVLLIVAPIALPSSVLYSSAITVQNIIDLTNRARVNLGLTELKQNSVLNIAAQNKADDMVLRQYFAHVSPSGQTPWNFIINAGYKYYLAGENLAVHFTSAEGVQEGWMASPTHRANIVNEKFKDLGVGISQGEFEGYPTTFVVQMFGTSQVQVAEAVTTKATTSLSVPSTTEPPKLVASTEKVSVINEQPDVSGVISQNPSIDGFEKLDIAVQSPSAESVNDESVVNKASTVTPVVENSSLQVIQNGDSYNLSITIHQAKEVNAILGSETVSLTKDTKTDNWSGKINFDSTLFNKHGELLFLIASSSDGTIVRQPLAWLAPNVPTQSFFTFNDAPTKYVKLFGFLTIDNLDNSVRQFYFYFILALSVALLFNILIKIRVQHLSVISHSAVVLVLALLLTLI